jgi:8-amino-7-oxononanoate synthase
MPLQVDRFAELELADLAGRGLIRAPDDGAARASAQAAARRIGRPFVDASSNDYLALGSSTVSRETDVQAGGGAPPGAGASRLIHGTHSAHLALEGALASWVGLPSALLFPTGYAANVGLLQALGARDTVLVSDSLNHASIVDGCRLARAQTVVVPHGDLGAIERSLVAARTARARWVVVESLYSMDGDGPDLARLRGLCDRHGAGLVVDEAHALGVLGPEGAGRCREAGVVPDAIVGTLGKAVGVQGAFVAGSALLRDLLWNRARTFVFSTAPSPRLAELALFHVQRARAADELRARLLERVQRLHAALRQRQLPLPEGLIGPIVPIVLGANDRALAAAAALADEGILAQAIRYPTVPEGSARLRLTVTAAWPSDAPAWLAAALARFAQGTT